MDEVTWAELAIDNAYRVIKRLEEQYNELGKQKRSDAAALRAIYATASYYGARAAVAAAVLQKNALKGNK